MQGALRMRTLKNMYLGIPYFLPKTPNQSEVTGLTYFVLPLKVNTLYIKCSLAILN